MRSTRAHSGAAVLSNEFPGEACSQVGPRHLLDLASPRVRAFISSRFKEDAGAFKTFSSDFSRRFKVQKFLTLVHDRRYSRHWIFEAKKRFGLCVLDYIL